ncbi:hypothetical protein [Pseudomonas fluorescens]|uniref:Uncharacterized protein n=1 Tax=Pseudomonas fluorescens TaxID=294 RepID=A0A5E7A239_PSEFL|nr:hypothetical protein PS710_00556 [Pseudomonas fluorescens]
MQKKCKKVKKGTDLNLSPFPPVTFSTEVPGRKREKKAADDAAKGIGRFQLEVAGVFMPDLKRLMKKQGFNNQQEVYQNLLRDVIAADFETAAQMLKCVTTPYEPRYTGIA